MLDQDVIQRAAERLVASARAPLQVTLFGSNARVGAHEDSDLDLMVVEEDIPDPSGESPRLREALGPIGVGVGLLVYSEAEFPQRRD